MHRRHRDGRDLDSSVDSGQSGTVLKCYIVTLLHCYICGFSTDWRGHRRHCISKHITYSWLLNILPRTKTCLGSSDQQYMI